MNTATPRGTEAGSALVPDTHEAQAERIAEHCARHPGQFFSARELAYACDLGCASKVLSAMVSPLGYGLAKDRRTVTCVAGTRSRRERIYRVTQCPRATQPDLFETK